MATWHPNVKYSFPSKINTAEVSLKQPDSLFVKGGLEKKRRSRNNWMVEWTELDKWLQWLGICRSDVWANLLFVKGNSTEGGGPGSSGKNAANVELGWHFYACCEPCLASASDGRTQIASGCGENPKNDMQTWHCRGSVYSGGGGEG